MRFSIWPSGDRPWSDLLDLAQHCDATGWYGFYVSDHFMPDAPGPVDGDRHEVWAVLAALAASVPRLRLAPLVASVTYRHPTVLANTAAMVDQISGGRLALGIGAGWQVNEHAAYGLPLGTVKERLDRFEEACAVIASMLRQPRTTFHGNYYNVEDAPCQPTPSRLPILIGGGGEKRTMRLAAKYADEWNAWTTPDVLAHKVGVLQRHCADLDRDPAEIAVSTQAILFLSKDQAWLDKHRNADYAKNAIVGTPEEVVEVIARYRDAGCDELIVPDFAMGPPSRSKDTCDMFLEEVATHFG
jgi:F420-dependent oxidoreductase-like protein